MFYNGLVSTTFNGLHVVVFVNVPDSDVFSSERPTEFSLTITGLVDLARPVLVRRGVLLRSDRRGDCCVSSFRWALLDSRGSEFSVAAFLETRARFAL